MSSHRSTATRNGFDKLAGPYRWLEYLSFGPFLWRTRCAFLPQCQHATRALLLGDGDGRFTAALLRSNRHLCAQAVDASANMLHSLRRRVIRQGNASRLRTHHADALTALPIGPFDLVCTHFFLDCLTTEQCGALARHVAERLQPDALWVVSEFAVPAGTFNLPARLLVRALYAAFGLLTGLRVRTLPNYSAALISAGLTRLAVVTQLCGILRSELWVLAPRSGPHTSPGHPMLYE